MDRAPTSNTIDICIDECLNLVFEYDLYGHPIMWDQENLYVHFTGIWKALGKTKADIVKIIDANPILETIIRKVRGGFLKIQGTWYVSPDNSMVP